MEIRLHTNATTTPKQRAYIQQSTRPAAELTVEIGVSETTTRRWRARDTKVLKSSMLISARHLETTLQ